MSTYTPSLGLELITPGSQAGLWGNTTNNSMNLIDQAITGVTELSFAAANGTTQVLTDDNGAANQARAAVLNITGSASGTNTVVVPNKQKMYLVRNDTGQTVIFQTAVPVNTYPVEAGYSILIFCDGNNNVFTGIAAPSVGTLSVSAGGTGTTGFGAGGFIKSTGGTNALSVASKVALASDVSGTLPVANGGTGAVSLVNGGLLVGQGTGAVASLVGAVNGYIPTWNSATSSWVAAAPTSSGVSSIGAGTGISVSGPTGAVVVSNSGVTGLSAGTGITLSGSTGNVTISSSGTAPVTAVFGRTGSITAQSTDYSAYYLSTSGTAANSSQLGGVAASGYVTTSTTQSITGSKTFSNIYTSFIQCVAYNMHSTTSMFCTTSGNPVQIAVNGQFPYYFYSNGTANATSWVSTSDARIKENVSPLEGGLDTIGKLNPVRFSFKKDKLSEPNHYGVIAQEIEEVLPDLVFTGQTDQDEIKDTKSVSYTELIPILIKAVQELKAEVDALKAAK